MFLFFEKPQQLDFENYQVNWWFFINIQILGFMVDGGQNDSMSKKTLFTLGCDPSPSSLLKEIWHWEKIQ